MRAHRLIRPAAGTGDIPAVTSLIEKLGTPDFPASLFRAASAWVMPEHMAAFVFDADMKPRTIFAENAGPAKVSQDVAVRYCREYYQYDLANRQLREAGYQGSWILKTSASEVIHSEYRHHCYTAVRLDDRISLSDTRDGRTLRINLYRPKGNDFTEDEIHSIGDKAPLMLALVRRHADLGAASRPNSHAYYRERLTAVAPTLTSREADVCAAIIRGVTSEGIALELGVGLNTVLTYKKRAYARLNISSQNQLMRLVLN